MGSSFRTAGWSGVALGLTLMLSGERPALAGVLETILSDGFESGAVCAWTSYVSPSIPGGCIIDDVCYAPGATDPLNQGCRTCNPAISQTAWQVVNNGGPCSDADACTVGDTCNNGVCQPSGIDSCDDGIGCTDDSCEPGSGCINDPQDTVCDDLLACTINFCDVGNDCQAVITNGFCLVEGACYADGAPDPGNPCRFCDADLNNEAFTLRGVGFECAPGSCLPGDLEANLPDTCDAEGVCQDSGIDSCPPYLCSGTACLSSCGSSAQCSDGNYCATNECVPKKAIGQACGAAEQCSSNFCVDGFCCVSACGGLCERCTNAAANNCEAVPNGTDPGNECTADLVSTCDQDGFCNGARACRLYANGTQCVAASCTGGMFPTGQNLADTCNGAGTCTDNGTIDCGNYLCNSGTGLCRTTCTEIFHCDAGFNCSGSPGNPGFCV